MRMPSRRKPLSGERSGSRAVTENPVLFEISNFMAAYDGEAQDMLIE
jgi:hypothetical protein